MKILERIADQLERTFEGEAWHGDSLAVILRGITFQKAAQKPLHNIHSIWEIVLHVIVWEEVVLKALHGEAYTMLHGEEDWPPVQDPDEEAWQVTLSRLGNITGRLKQAILSFSEPRLDEDIPGQHFTFYVALHGVVQHNLYHAGQIAILKKSLC